LLYPHCFPLLAPPAPPVLLALALAQPQAQERPQEQPLLELAHLLSPPVLAGVPAWLLLRPY